jgi:hypothetical protein
MLIAGLLSMADNRGSECRLGVGEGADRRHRVRMGFTGIQGPMQAEAELSARARGARSMSPASRHR